MVSVLLTVAMVLLAVRVGRTTVHLLQLVNPRRGSHSIWFNHAWRIPGGVLHSSTLLLLSVCASCNPRAELVSRHTHGRGSRRAVKQPSGAQADARVHHPYLLAGTDGRRPSPASAMSCASASWPNPNMLPLRGLAGFSPAAGPRAGSVEVPGGASTKAPAPRPPRRCEQGTSGRLPHPRTCAAP